MDAPVYLTQCMFGHAMEVIPGTELEAKCKARTALDALILDATECPECIEENRERESRNANMCGNCGCPFMPLDDEDDPCAASCMAGRNYRAIKDSPYKGQLRGLPANV